MRKEITHVYGSFFHNNILLPDEIIDIADYPLKRDERRIGSALIKNAYLLLFAKTGYSFLTDSYYDDLRLQIANPEVFYLPEGLWTAQNISIDDGIYLTQDNRYRGFFCYIHTKTPTNLSCLCFNTDTPNSFFICSKRTRKNNRRYKS